MQAAHVHQILRQGIGPALLSRGFEPVTKARASWRIHCEPAGYLFVRTHIGWWGTDDALGGWFRIELMAGPTAHISQTEPIHDDVYAHFLTDADKSRLLALANQARLDIPGHEQESIWKRDDLPYNHPRHVARYAFALSEMMPRIVNEYALRRELSLTPLRL